MRCLANTWIELEDAPCSLFQLHYDISSINKPWMCYIPIFFPLSSRNTFEPTRFFFPIMGLLHVKVTLISLAYETNLKGIVFGNDYFHPYLSSLWIELI
jgi:hypothetical protein